MEEEEEEGEVVKRLHDNLARYRSIQQSLNALLYKLADAYAKLRLANNAETSSVPRSKCQQRVLELLEGIEKAERSETHKEARANAIATSAIPLWAKCSEIEGPLAVENACFSQLQLLQQEESSVLSRIKRDFEALLREEDVLVGSKKKKSHWEFLCKASEALDAVESDYRMKELIVDRLVTHWQSAEDEATFIYTQLLSLRPFLKSETFGQVEIALEALEIKDGSFKG